MRLLPISLLISVFLGAFGNEVWSTEIGEPLPYGFFKNFDELDCPCDFRMTFLGFLTQPLPGVLSPSFSGVQATSKYVNAERSRSLNPPPDAFTKKSEEAGKLAQAQFEREEYDAALESTGSAIMMSNSGKNQSAYRCLRAMTYASIGNERLAVNNLILARRFWDYPNRELRVAKKFVQRKLFVHKCDRMSVISSFL
jgi:hypothetical protein